MPIILNQKDADWVANLVREKIKNLNEAYEDSVTKTQKEVDSIVSICDSIFSSDGEIQSKVESLKEIQKESVDEMKKTYNQKLSDYYRIIELMMVGSCKE